MNVLRTDWTFKRRKCYLRDEQSGELSWCGVIMATLNACKRNNKIPKTPESRPSAPWFLRLLQSKIPLHRGPHSTRMTGPNLRRLEFYSVGVYVVKKWKFVASDTRWFWGRLKGSKIRQWRSFSDFQGLFGRKKWTFNLDLAKAAKIECHPAKIERAQMVPRTPSRKGPTGLKLVSMSLLGGHFGWVFRVPNGRQSRNYWWSLSHWTEMGRAAMWFLGHQWRSETTLH